MLGDPASSDDGSLGTRDLSHQLSGLLIPCCNRRTRAAGESVGCVSSEEGMVFHFM